MFRDLLDAGDADRAVGVLQALRGHGLDGALTGGLAIEVHLRARGHQVPRRALNDVDLVVGGIDDVPQSLAGEFLLNHVHPDAPEGKTLVQAVDRERRLRIDLFRALGRTLDRVVPWRSEVATLQLVAIEDLVARQTSLVCGSMERERAIDVKHVRSFLALDGLGEPDRLETAWVDHRQEVAGTLSDAARRARAILERRPELVVVETYDPRQVECERCRPHGDLIPAPPVVIAGILGYS